MIDHKQFDGHTAGKWCVVPAQHGGMYIRGFDGTNVARVGLDINHGERQIELNARLIAAAPDLLADNKRLRAALESLLHRCISLDRSATHEGILNCEAMAHARAALSGDA